MTIKSELTVVRREIKALTEKVDEILKDFINIDETNAAKQSPKKTAKAKATKKAPEKKSQVRTKRSKLTATEQVLRIIMKRKRGIDTPTLIHKTGFDEKKVRNIVFRAFKEGKIKRVGRGLYAGMQ